ncbi:MAG: hypothetical protein U0414_11105 [Polyangiaceae bacterium]
MSRIFVTCNSEYGVRDRRVVAVRHRGERAWQRSHRAVGMCVVSDPRTLQIGDVLMLASGDELLTTSKLVGVRRGTVMSNAA